MPTNTHEIAFETFIDNYLTDQLSYIKRSDREHYSQDLCMDKELVIQFIKETQTHEWEELEELDGEDAEPKLFKRLDDEIQARGLIDVLRKGIKHNGGFFRLAFFKPASKLNRETEMLYRSNIFSIMRQVHYSKKNNYSIDMVLFLNGLPIYTIELKNDISGQNVNDAIRQYKTDRDQKEKLLSFKRTLVHFAIDNEQVYMTTKLNGNKTKFLPFNKGDGNSAGNPLNPNGYKVSYMWEDFWTPDYVLEIISDFVELYSEEKISPKGKRDKEEKLIFPRYHQFDTVHRLVVHSRDLGTGQKYLIQHSAGSGKTNTISWTALRLASLHDDSDNIIFDSVIVISDRRILDKQLKDNIKNFQQIQGTVTSVDHSSDLKRAIEQGDKVIVSTLQKFRVIVDEIQKQKNKKYAVIIDEAHSSQSGENIKSLKKSLNNNNNNINQTEEELDLEDILNQEIQNRKQLNNVSFFAFTATPKSKTLELFGQKNAEGEFVPFSLYSMKQAIEEGFIIDVLKNYTTYDKYFTLFKTIDNDPKYKKKQATALMLKHIESEDAIIEQKIHIIVNHFWNNISKLIEGKAKAMIVTKSRLQAVKYKLVIDKFLKNNNYPFTALVAFSGEVSVNGANKPYTESQLNGFSEDKTKAYFNENDECKFLIVAEKYQTGFDEPLLCAMYVDKKLRGVNAVQTLSRLNRTRAHKEEVFVLDFENTVEDIKDAFQPYYTSTILSEATDPNILYDLERDIMQSKIFEEKEIASFLKKYFSNTTPDKLQNELNQIPPRFAQLTKEEKQILKSKVNEYISNYAFLSQILNFSDTNLEKLYAYLRFARHKMPIEKEKLPIEVIQSIDIDSYELKRNTEKQIKLEDKEGALHSTKIKKQKISEDLEESLSKIIKDINERFGDKFNAKDLVKLEDLEQRLEQDKDLAEKIKNNSIDNAKLGFESSFEKHLISIMQEHLDFYQKIDSDYELKNLLKEELFKYLTQKLLRLS